MVIQTANPALQLVFFESSDATGISGDCLIGRNYHGKYLIVCTSCGYAGRWLSRQTFPSIVMRVSVSVSVSDSDSTQQPPTHPYIHSHCHFHLLPFAAQLYPY